MQYGLRAVCWPQGGTVGCITPTSALLHGRFGASEGDDAVVDCDLVAAGKYRNGAARAWCRIHQRYRGVKADLADFAASGRVRCAGHADGLGYALDPRIIDLTSGPDIAVSLNGSGGLHIATADGPAESVKAFAVVCPAGMALFDVTDIAQVSITPPALRAWLSFSRSSPHPPSRRRAPIAAI